MGCVISGVGLQNWLTSKIKLTTDNVKLLHYNNPLTSQVEALEPTDRLYSLQVGTTQNHGPAPTGSRISNLRVRFTIPLKHTDKESTV